MMHPSLSLVGTSQSQSELLPAHDTARPDAAIVYAVGKIMHLFHRRRFVMAATGRTVFKFKSALQYSLVRPYHPDRYLEVPQLCKPSPHTACVPQAGGLING
jgi:hypothetical protein